ncbi:MAG: HsdR family type I site-specific deoxyribonuclease [Oribacterium sp.]|jgi:type I restriction enzyme R subunit|nr:HsdR family type I site-specific deoxyribonuclease [Oribacterium sp.]MDY6316289.1 HsdR family type I site-specific deoxyribonuclease [Oribacterium sp.]
MAELESVIEKRLIEQLCNGDSQWTYRSDITTEEALWGNFKYILEQNNKAKLDDQPLSETEFAKIKNDLSHASFYDAARWLVGENGKVYVHVLRGSTQLHLVVLDNEQIAGGTSVYEVINQYQAFKDEEEDSQNRRFDVTLLINGIPLIHIELKNKDHSYMEGYRQIKKYVAEGKFHGLFSNVQLFVVSNVVDTKYFAPARDTEFNKKFLFGWLDKNNEPVVDYLAFAKEVLRIPEAHEMVAKYTVLDNESKKLIILRPYQIHAIQAIRAASKQGESGFVWHTTGSGKTMTSYKATRNLIMDIPSIDKAIFLIDRKALDQATRNDFQSYALNDTIDVDDTDNVSILIKRLMDGSRKMIVTTRQKMQILITKRLKEGTKQYDAIKNLRVAFVVDECHRAVTPQTKRDLEAFFQRSLWYGFTGTPIFPENSYEQKGDLPQTTEQLYGKCLHSYTIKEAIHDEAVLGFMVECLGPKGLSQEEAEQLYGTEQHMRSVLDVILNKSYTKFGLQKGRGKTYEAILTVDSIEQAQRYYDLLKKVVAGEDELKICDAVKKALPDFPKFAITYSISENDEASKVNQDKMKESLKDYNAMFGTHYSMENIGTYNDNLNDRLTRKKNIYLDRNEQLDLVIVVDRLLTGFNAPSLSTIFMDRPPMAPQNIIQAFSRTNRLFDADKQYGQVVTFQYPVEFKKAIDDALLLYSRGGTGNPVSEDFNTVKEHFTVSVKAIRALAKTPKDIEALSKKQKKAFVHLFQDLDKSFAHLKAFSTYDPVMLEETQFSQNEYEDYAAMYKNVVEELKGDDGDDGDDLDGGDDPIIADYDLIAYSKIKIDYEYIVQLLQGFVDYLGKKEDFSEAEFEKKIKYLRDMIGEFEKDNPKLGALLMRVLDQIQANKELYAGSDISVIINRMRYAAADSEIRKFSEKWFVPFDDVRYEAYNYRNGELPNESVLKENANYSAYKAAKKDSAVPKFKFRKELIDDFKNDLMTEIGPLF